MIVIQGETSVIRRIHILDSASTTGAGKTGLAYDTSGWAVTMWRAGQTSETSITLENITTLNTYQAPSSDAHVRFKEVGYGEYEIHLPNNWFSISNNWKAVKLFFKGPSGVVPLPIMFEVFRFDLHSLFPSVTVTAASEGALPSDVFMSPPDVNVATNGITSSSIQTGAFTWAKFASDFGTGVASDIVTALNASTVDGTLTELQAKRLILAVLAGKASVGTGTVAFKRADGTTTALTVEHDQNGNRTVITLGSL